MRGLLPFSSAKNASQDIDGHFIWKYDGGVNFGRRQKMTREEQKRFEACRDQKETGRAGW